MAPRQPVAWSHLAALVALKGVLHSLSNGPLAYGLMTDELYYLDCAARLDWGYVDHPPLSIFLLRISNELLGTSIVAVRSVAVLASCATLVFAALIARELGGGRVAQMLAAAAVAASPVHLSMAGFYSMNPIDMLLWAVAFWLLVRLANGAPSRTWLALGACVGLGIMNKLSMTWLAGGLAVGLLATRERRWLATPWPWLGAAVALACVAPNLLWQQEHDWPTLEFLRNSATQKEFVASSPPVFLATQLFTAGLPLWPIGLGYLAMARSMARFRLFAWIVACVMTFLAVSGSAKLYYAAPAFSVALAAAGVAVERAGRRARFAWAPKTTAAGLVVAGFVAAPYAISLFPPERLVAYQRLLGAEPVGVDVGEQSPLHQGFAQMFHGPAVTAAVAKAVATLSDDERSRVGILTHQFGESGGINFYGPARGLPPAIGTQGSYWLWGPGDVGGELMLEISESEQELRMRYAEVERVAEIDCAYCLPRFTRNVAT